ncbi:MAG: methyltransferase domain-containing protein [Rhodobacter sp.]|nr:methyltransferase domain-containing protein [Rhodobacter sp.]
MTAPPDPRRMAALMVQGVIDGQMLPDVPVPAADPATRAQAQRLALATLRNLQRADTVLRPHLRHEPVSAVMAALRVGVVAMLDQNEAAHGVVNATVEALKANPATARAAGLANAVLRKAARHDGWAALPVQRLPGWLRRRLKGVYGETTLQAIEAAHHRGAALDLTLKPGARAPEGADPVGASWRLNAGVQVSALPGYDAGDWWVQDAAAALPAGMLAVQPGETVLDLCAAPGGKTMQLAAAGARVTALDLSQGRLKRLHENLERTGLTAAIVCADVLDWTPPAPVDAVLLDAPCSATGTIRRHPDLPMVRKPADVEGLTDLQARLIDRALTFLKPGGRLVYCTCSLLPDEGEAQVAAALARHPGLTAATPPQPLGRATAEGGWRTRPDDHETGIDGFYMALLRRAPA